MFTLTILPSCVLVPLAVAWIVMRPGVWAIVTMAANNKKESEPTRALRRGLFLRCIYTFPAGNSTCAARFSFGADCDHYFEAATTRWELAISTGFEKDVAGENEEQGLLTVI